MKRRYLVIWHRCDSECLRRFDDFAGRRSCAADGSRCICS